MTTAKPRVFVIMPFADEFQSIYDELICPALDEYVVERADSRLDQRGILAKIVSGIAEADLVIADVTATNPNVMYELGIAHALGRPTIMLSQDTSRLPFDIKAYPVQPYSTHFSRARDLLNRLRELGVAHKSGFLEFSNPVTDFLPTGKSSPIPDANATPAVAAEPYGMVEFRLDMQEAPLELRTTFGALSESTAHLDKALRELTHRASETQQSDAFGTTARLKALADEAAEAISRYARDTETNRPPLRRAFERYQRGGMWIVRPEQWQTLSSEEKQVFGTSIKEFLDRTTASIGLSSDFKSSLGQLRFISGSVASAVDAGERALDSLIGDFLFARSALTRILDLATD